MRKQNITKKSFFCDESGYSGNVLVDTDYEKYLRQQPIFITAGVYTANNSDYKELTKKYADFLASHDFNGDELKGELFSPSHNDALKDFIKWIVSDSRWNISVVDKKFKLFVDVLMLFLPYGGLDERTYGVYDVACSNKDKADKTISLFFETAKTGDLKKFYKDINTEINFLAYKKYVSFDNLIDGWNLYVNSKKYLNVDHIDSLHSMIFERLNEYQMKQCWYEYQYMTNHYDIYYDNNDEFESINEKDYIDNIDLKKIQFLDSKEAPLIQLADNIARLFSKYFKYELYEPKNAVADDLFKNLNINYLGRANLFMYEDDKERFIKSAKDFRDVLDEWNLK